MPQREDAKNLFVLKKFVLNLRIFQTKKNNLKIKVKNEHLKFLPPLEISFYATLST